MTFYLVFNEFTSKTTDKHTATSEGKDEAHF